MRKRRKLKKARKQSTFYRPYAHARNFAEFRCHRVPYEKDHCYVKEFLKTVTGRYSYNSAYYFFYNKEDAIAFRLSF